MALLAVAVSLGAAADAQTAASAAASAPKKHKRASTAKTPPGKPPRGAAPCNQSDKAQRERCLRDLYGPGAPPA